MRLGSNKKKKTIKKDLEALMRQEKAILKQKSRIQWLKLGHNNSTYFDKMTKDKQMRNSIRALLSLEGTQTTNVKPIEAIIV